MFGMRGVFIPVNSYYCHYKFEIYTLSVNCYGALYVFFVLPGSQMRQYNWVIHVLKTSSWMIHFPLQRASKRINFVPNPMLS